MTVWFLLFAMAFSSGLALQKARGSQSTSARTVFIGIALLFAIVFFGYIIGKDLAVRDNHRSTSSAPAGAASAAISSAPNRTAEN